VLIGATSRIPLTFEVLTPREVCVAFSKGVGHPCTYRRGPIEIKVQIPIGYREHLEILQQVLGDQRAPYFGPTMYYPSEAIELWEGNRGIEAYAREVFPVEEAANGQSWMEDDGSDESVGEDSTATGTSNGTKGKLASKLVVFYC